jgi:hypothetical protein
MISYSVYKLIHILGICGVVMGLGAAFAASRVSVSLSGDQKPAITRKIIAITHGLGLFLVLLGGFGMLARLQMHWPLPWWVIVKIIVWVGLGAWLTVTYKSASKGVAAWLGGLSLVALAIFVVLAK